MSIMTFPDTLRYKPALKSGADLSDKVGYMAVISGSTWVLGGDDTGTHVILNGGAASGDYCEVASGHVMALAGATVAANDYVESNASGLLITSAGGKHPIGRAITGGSVGEWIEVYIYGKVDEVI